MRGIRLVWVWVALMAASCGNGGATGDVVTEDDSGTEILMGSGESITIELEANASTGYGWVVAEPTASGVVDVVESRYDEPDTDLVGAPGTQVYVIEAVREGAGILRLEYLRSFDDPPVPAKVVEYIIRVDGAPWPPTS
jgi:inhibitor of cysteine peptidase